MEEQPLSPGGRMFLRPEMDQIIHGLIGIDDNAIIDIPRCKADITSSLLLRHPRFNSLLVLHPKTGRRCWRPTQVHLERHFIIVQDPVCGGGENAVNDYLADLCVSFPLPLDKPLWEIHILMAHKCAVFRIHHALGDGISLVKLLLTCCRRVDDANALPKMATGEEDHNVKESYNELKAMRKKNLTFWGVVKLLWLTLIFVFEFMGRALWVKDKKTALSGAKGVKLWPRKIATASFLIHDMKLVKAIIPGCTVNDVLFGVLSCSLSRYLDSVDSSSSNKPLKNGTKFTGVAVANLRVQPGVQALTMHMMSFAAKAEMQIMVAKDLIPDPQVLAKLFEDSLQRPPTKAPLSR